MVISAFRPCSALEILWFGVVVRYFVISAFRLCSEAEILCFGSIVCCCHVLRNYVLYKDALFASYVYNDLRGNLVLCNTTIVFANIVYDIICNSLVRDQSLYNGMLYDTIYYSCNFYGDFLRSCFLYDYVVRGNPLCGISLDDGILCSNMFADHAFYINIVDDHILYINIADDHYFCVHIIHYYVLYINTFAEHLFYINIVNYHVCDINNADDRTFCIHIMDYHVLYISVFADDIFCISIVGYHIIHIIIFGGCCPYFYINMLEDQLFYINITDYHDLYIIIFDTHTHIFLVNIINYFKIDINISTGRIPLSHVVYDSVPYDHSHHHSSRSSYNHIFYATINNHILYTLHVFYRDIHSEIIHDNMFHQYALYHYTVYDEIYRNCNLYDNLHHNQFHVDAIFVCDNMYNALLYGTAFYPNILTDHDYILRRVIVCEYADIIRNSSTATSWTATSSATVSCATLAFATSCAATRPTSTALMTRSTMARLPTFVSLAATAPTVAYKKSLYDLADYHNILYEIVVLKHYVMLYDRKFAFYVGAIDGLAKSVEASRYYVRFAIIVNGPAKLVGALQFYHMGINGVTGDDFIQSMGVINVVKENANAIAMLLAKTSVNGSKFILDKVATDDKVSYESKFGSPDVGCGSLFIVSMLSQPSLQTSHSFLSSPHLQHGAWVAFAELSLFESCFAVTPNGVSRVEPPAAGTGTGPSMA
ncbi:unnamed protein product [Symbiodinium pilosum]|uniref:Uncharacterized protein n=1 Tax=Symbiodinium pilosum TaxID=2952 RepID=A0A812TV59_SYMPI|nr:unnamed protein product [Symbiodinium pilosum]